METAAGLSPCAASRMVGRRLQVPRSQEGAATSCCDLLLRCGTRVLLTPQPCGLPAHRHRRSNGVLRPLFRALNILERNVMKLSLLAALGMALGMIDSSTGGASVAATEEDVATLTGRS